MKNAGHGLNPGCCYWCHASDSLTKPSGPAASQQARIPISLHHKPKFFTRLQNQEMAFKGRVTCPISKLSFFHLICLLVDIKHVCKFLAFKSNYFVQKTALLYYHKNGETSYFWFRGAVTLHVRHKHNICNG